MPSTNLSLKRLYIISSAVSLLLINSSFTPVFALSRALSKGETEKNSLSLFAQSERLYLSQQFPNPATPDFPPKPLPQLPTDRDIPLESPQVPSPDAEDFLNIPGVIFVKGFRFEGNTAFTDEELAKVTAPYENKEISFVKLLQAEAAVRQQYIQGCNSNNQLNATKADQPCYINSDVFIPIQKIEDGMITIQIVEGGIEKIEITGTKRLAPDYIKSRLELVTRKQPFNLNELLEALRLLQINPLIGSVLAELAEGVSPEKSLLIVEVTEADSFDFVVIANNNRVPSVGSFRRGFNLREGNLLGFGDNLGFSWWNTDGSNNFDLSYGIPINAHNAEILLAGGYRDTEIIEEPFDRIDITGDYWYSDLTFRQPLAQSAREEFALGFTLSLQESTTKLQGERSFLCLAVLMMTAKLKFPRFVSFKNGLNAIPREFLRDAPSLVSDWIFSMPP